MKKFIVLGFAFLLLSCSSQLYVPIESIDSVSLIDLKAGRDLYVKKCSSCHQLHLPNEFTATVWGNNLDEMQARAKITNEEKQLIYHYLVNAPKK